MVGDAVGRGWYSGSVWNTRDGAQGLGGLEVSRGRTTTDSVETGGSHVLPITDLEGAVLGVVGGIVCTPKTIIDVLTICTWRLAFRVADLDTETIATHEADMRQDMLKLAIKQRTHFVQSRICS